MKQVEKIWSRSFMYCIFISHTHPFRPEPTSQTSDCSNFCTFTLKVAPQIFSLPVQPGSHSLLASGPTLNTHRSTVPSGDPPTAQRKPRQGLLGGKQRRTVFHRENARVLFRILLLSRHHLGLTKTTPLGSQSLRVGLVRHLL